ncbi:MAG TPA: GC-type dockerin domain-anchored protein [Phycisphaerales bacterium]|nr:GC-type dockerin domain-anchored protein [Phycisphaerales bacterium]
MIKNFLTAAVLAVTAAPSLAGDNLPPFDFSNSFYLENGINPVGLIGRPVGNPPGSVIDNRENGPDFNNVRILSHAATYDHSGHRWFFYVTGILRENNFTPDAAGQEAREIAEEYKVYEFPKAGAPLYSVFPKRQDSVADMRNGYFSNNPLGIWQVNIVRYVPEAMQTPEAQAELAELAARNGLDNDGTPIIKTISEIEDLLDMGLVTNVVPPAGTTALRWFFCPIIEDPDDGAIAPDAFLNVTENSDAQGFRDLFAALQGEACPADFNGSGSVTTADISAFLTAWFADISGGTRTADFNNSGVTNTADVSAFLSAWFAAIAQGGC